MSETHEDIPSTRSPPNDERYTKIHGSIVQPNTVDDPARLPSPTDTDFDASGLDYRSLRKIRLCINALVISFQHQNLLLKDYITQSEQRQRQMRPPTVSIRNPLDISRYIEQMDVRMSSEETTAFIISKMCDSEELFNTVITRLIGLLGL